MKNYMYCIALLVTTLALLAGCSEVEGLLNNNSDKANPTQPLMPEGENTSFSIETTALPAAAEVKVGDSLPLSRGLAAKMAALAFNDVLSIETMDREITVTDSSADKWYDKYINAVVLQKLMAPSGNVFMPDQPLSISEAQNLISAMNISTSIKIKITDENKDKAISYALWCQLYTQCLEEMAGASGIKEGYGINTVSFVALGDNSNNDKLPQGAIIADSGPYSALGLDFSAYIDKRITCLEKDGEIIAIISLDSQTPEIRNAYVASHTNSAITIFSGGAERTYGYAGNNENMKGKICDLTIENGTAKNIVFHNEMVSDTVKRISNEQVELAAKGKMPIGEDFKIYTIADGPVKWKSVKNIIVGTDIAKFYVANNMVVAAVIDKKPVTGNIRVAIKNTGFDSFYHEMLTISANAPYTVKSQNDEKAYNAGEKAYFNDVLNLTDRVYVTCDTGMITIETINRGYGQPAYRGSLEISADPQGFLLVNEVNLEQYLYSVVPSEMPTSYGLESLKVQAVTARSYAYNQYFANTFHAYGANVCDSVISQVYNNVAENDASRQAVDSTKGLCLTYDGGVISANFFSTSAGVTANNGEVWANAITKQFPTENSPYLVSAPQYQGADYGDLSIEENAAKFFKSKEVTAFDSDVSWFRWYAEMTNEEISASINNNLSARYEANPKLIKTLQADGIFRSRTVESIGQLVNIEVVKRGQGGNIMTMKLTGTENTILVNTEYNIRMLIKPKQLIDGQESIDITLSDGKIISDYALMPSTFFAMERMTDGAGKIMYVKFYGGGNGHGVGMSQTGVKGMVDVGYSFADILQHYYRGTKVEAMW